MISSVCCGCAWVLDGAATRQKIKKGGGSLDLHNLLEVLPSFVNDVSLLLVNFSTEVYEWNKTTFNFYMILLFLYSIKNLH